MMNTSPYHSYNNWLFRVAEEILQTPQGEVEKKAHESNGIGLVPGTHAAAAAKSETSSLKPLSEERLRVEPARQLCSGRSEYSKKRYVSCWGVETLVPLRA